MSCCAKDKHEIETMYDLSRIMNIFRQFFETQGYDVDILNKVCTDQHTELVARNANFIKLPFHEQNMVNSIFFGISPHLYAGMNSLQLDDSLIQRYQELAALFNLKYVDGMGINPTMNIHKDAVMEILHSYRKK